MMRTILVLALTSAFTALAACSGGGSENAAQSGASSDSAVTQQRSTAAVSAGFMAIASD